EALDHGEVTLDAIPQPLAADRASLGPAAHGLLEPPQVLLAGDHPGGVAGALQLLAKAGQRALGQAAIGVRGVEEFFDVAVVVEQRDRAGGLLVERELGGEGQQKTTKVAAALRS